VTRWGEFSRNGLLFNLGVFLKITEVDHIFGLLFPQLRLCINFERYFSHILGYFFPQLRICINFERYFSHIFGLLFPQLKLCIILNDIFSHIFGLLFYTVKVMHYFERYFFTHFWATFFHS
jgi:hypothetical protein